MELSDDDWIGVYEECHWIAMAINKPFVYALSLGWMLVALIVELFVHLDPSINQSHMYSHESIGSYIAAPTMIFNDDWCYCNSYN